MLEVNTVRGVQNQSGLTINIHIIRNNVIRCQHFSSSIIQTYCHKGILTLVFFYYAILKWKYKAMKIYFLYYLSYIF